MRAGKERLLLERAVAVQHDLATVGVGVGDAAERPDRVRMLGRAVDFDPDRAGVVFFQQVLHRVQVVLAHVAQPAAVIIPVAAEGAVGAVLVVGLEGRRTEPQVIVESLRNRFGLEVGQPAPEELERESLPLADHRAQRPAEQPVFDHLFDGLDLGAESVEAALEAEPGVEPENAPVGFDRLHHALALSDGAGHRFLAPDVLARLGGHFGDQAVPVGRGADVYNVHVGAGEDFPEILAGEDFSVTVLLGILCAVADMGGVGVAQCHQPGGLVPHVVAGVGNAAVTDQCARQLVAGRGFGTEHACRHDGESGQRGGPLQERSATTQRTHTWSPLLIGEKKP